MEVQKHESQGRPNLFDLDQWLSEHVRARQHLVYEEPVKCPPPNRGKPPKQDRPMNSSTLHIKGDPQPKGEEPTNKEPKSPACLRCNQAHPFTDVMNLKESLYLSAMRWPRVSRCASIVSSRDIKLINARTKLIAKSLTVRDTITVCYTMNVQHLSHRPVRTHKLGPR